MNRSQAEQRVRDLHTQLRHHDFLYYVKDAPEISDEAYDALYHELKALEERFPDLRTADSPTQRVAGVALDEFPKVRHAAPMLSLDSSQDESALRRFDERLRKLLDTDVRYVVEPKLDGASVELVYEGGVLVRASTRGDGQVGEGITENVRTIRTVPLRLREAAAAPVLLAVRGEILMRVSAFERLNERLIADGLEPFANPRNAAAGSLRQLDPQITAQRPLDFYAYDILAVDGAAPGSQWAILALLRDWGFPVNELVARAAGVPDVIAYHAELAGRRDDLEYEIDGVVVKLDDVGSREEVGATSHHPRWAFAFKFLPRKEVTRILAIVPSVGRTGVVTPVAILRPVELGGVTVSRASLHNREEVARKDVREGDRVRVQRAGDVIPQVVERVDEPGRERGAPFRMPPACPSCGTPLVERGPYTVCPNGFECPAQLAGRIQHFASRDALDIEGLGEETSKQLVDAKLIRQLPDLFDLTVEQLLPLDGFAAKSAQNLVDGIRRAAAAELDRFLFGLGIPEVGVAVARDLARHFGSFAALRRASREELEEVRGVGPKMAEQIAGFFADRKHGAALDLLLAKLSLQESASRPARPGGAPLDGCKFVLTGGLARLTRQAAKELIESLGGRVVSAVSRETDYVVYGEDPGSKYAKARELGIALLDEEAFVSLLRSKGVEV